MEMKIDALRIRTERERRAWSQEHLAEVAGLALRTIQRVEATGSGSFETMKALASVLMIDVSELRAPMATTQKRSSYRIKYLGLAAALVVCLIGFSAHRAHATQIALEVDLALNGESLSSHRMVVDDGNNAEIRLEGQVRILVVPTDSTEGVLLSIQVYEFADQQFVLAGTPSVLARHAVVAEVRFTSMRGNTFRIAIKPNKV